jgi:hypothetical protein
MIKIEHTEVVGLEHAIRGMRNSWESWDKSDSFRCYSDDCQMGSCPYYTVDGGYGECNKYDLYITDYIIGKHDLELMKKLSKAGTDHRKFMRMITVYVDITAPMYWWKEMDTYKVGTVRNSCSTMHKITDKEFTLDDFSSNALTEDEIKSSDVWIDELGDSYYGDSAEDVFNQTVKMLNTLRLKYIETKDKKYWNAIIQLLPSSYNQKSTLMLNYEVLANIYKSRKNHKLTEWQDLCAWIKTLPYSEIITGEE